MAVALCGYVCVAVLERAGQWLFMAVCVCMYVSLKDSGCVWLCACGFA